MAHRKWRTSCVAHELRNADEGAGWCVCRRLHDYMGGKWGSERAEGVQEGRFSRTARYHEVCAADKDGNDGGGGSEHREQWWVLPESVY